MRQRTIPVSISMPPALALRLRVQAAKNDKSRSQFVCEILEKALSPTVPSNPTPHPQQESPHDPH